MRTGIRSISRIGAELREIASFPLTPAASNRLALLADQLVEIGDLQRRLAELVETSDKLTPWLLQEALQLPGYMSARILCILARRAGMFIARDMLVYQADTTIGGITQHLWSIRKALASIGLEGELTSRDGCYRLSIKGVEELKHHCQASVRETRDIDYPKRILELLAVGDLSAADADGLFPIPAERKVAALSDLDLRFLMSLSSFVSPRSLSYRIMQSLLESRETYISAKDLAAMLQCSPTTLKVTIHRLRRCFTERRLPDPVESNRIFGYRLSRSATRLPDDL